MMHTVNRGVVRLDVSRLDLAIFNDEGVALATVVAEDRRAIEGEVEILGESTRWVCQEADL